MMDSLENLCPWVIRKKKMDRFHSKFPGPQRHPSSRKESLFIIMNVLKQWIDKALQRKALKKGMDSEWTVRETPEPAGNTELISLCCTVLCVPWLQFYSIDEELCQLLSSPTLSPAFSLITLTTRYFVAVCTAELSMSLFSSIPLRFVYLGISVLLAVGLSLTIWPHCLLSFTV